MTSWIDGSFVYSTKEAWVNAMRTFVNGTFKTIGDPVMGMPPFNKQRIPMFNMPAPNVLKMQSPERMYRKWTHSKSGQENTHCQWNCGQSYKHFMIVNYGSRVVIWGIIQSGTTLES